MNSKEPFCLNKTVGMVSIDLVNYAHFSKDSL